jgi:uncharacterized protein (TIGR00297 family)
MPPITDLAAIPAAGAVALAAWRLRAVAPSGVAAAWFTGATIVLAAGWGWGALLVLYFVAASALSKLPARRDVDTGITGRDHRRDAVQVLANGGIPLAAAIAWAVAPQAIWPLVYVTALAGASADTWATELGSRFGGTPRSIVTGRRLPTGLSGGVTIVGFAASLAAPIAIASVARLLVHPAPPFAAVIIGGVVTSLTDSLLGATIQARYYCPACNRPTEQTTHRCGQSTTRIHGVPFVTNDVVNVTSIALGLLAAYLLA